MKTNDLQNITHKSIDRVTRTPQKTGVNSGAPEGETVHVFCVDCHICKQWMGIRTTPRPHSLCKPRIIDVDNMIEIFPLKSGV